MRDKVRTMSGLFNEIVRSIFLVTTGYLLGPLQDSAHLAAAEELLSLSGLLTSKQQHMVRGPHLSLHGVIVVFCSVVFLMICES